MPKLSKTQISPRKAPAQARAQATVGAILDAAARVLSKESLAGFNTNRVAQVAGVSVGSLYQYFPGKDALMAALIERAQQQLVEQAEEALERLRSETYEVKLWALADLAIDQQFAKPLYAAALDHEERRLPVRALIRATEQRLAALVHGLLQPHCPNLSLIEASDALVITKALVDAHADARQPPPDLRDRIVRALRGYLGARI
jgi:AcrR family transcriptional regulator